MSDVIGWNLIYKLSENDLKKKEDVLTLMIHFLLIKAGYKCVGLGDDKTTTGSESGSETLPEQWNGSTNFSLRYVLNGDLYILRGVPVDDNIVYNFLRVDTLAVTNVAFNVNETVDAIKGPLEKLFKNKESEVVEKIRIELLNTGPGKDISTQTPAANSNSTSTQQKQTGTSPSPPQPNPPPLHVPRIPDAVPDPIWVNPDQDPLRVGRSDLDPFGRGGGMIFNPFGPRGSLPDPGAGIPGGLPRGSVPPGARFDPFGPPGASHPRPRPPPPDADDFLPPWYM
ncbi:hypothetical protein O3M35_008703 [Rhynocoris fuscipes]|uniref:Proteasome inhibitor PI31 subunit n=1 Tax=Rhynocoris fuscipes TaxID=488301 RepID=A0AAW1D769_9HEMI